MILGYELCWKMFHLHRNKLAARKNLYNQKSLIISSAARLKNRSSCIMARCHYFSLKKQALWYILSLCNRPYVKEFILRNFNLDTSNGYRQRFSRLTSISIIKNTIFKYFFKYFWVLSPFLFFSPKHFTHFHQLI